MFALCVKKMKPKEAFFTFLSIISFIIVCSLPGCGIVYQPGSIPSRPTDGTWKLGSESYYEGGSNPIDVLYGKKIDIGIRTYNQGASTGLLLYPVPFPISVQKDLGDKYFAITIGFRSEYDVININLKELFLTMQDASKIYPIGIIKRNNKYKSSMANLSCVSDELYESKENKYFFHQYLKLSENTFSQNIPNGSCIDLFFNIVPPNPEEEFSLQMGELKENDNVLEIPSIRFEKGNVFKGI